MTAKPTILLEQYLKQLKPPTFQREYAPMAAMCSKEKSDYPTYLLKLADRNGSHALLAPPAAQGRNMRETQVGCNGPQGLCLGEHLSQRMDPYLVQVFAQRHAYALSEQPREIPRAVAGDVRQAFQAAVFPVPFVDVPEHRVHNAGVKLLVTDQRCRVVAPLDHGPDQKIHGGYAPSPDDLRRRGAGLPGKQSVA